MEVVHDCLSEESTGDNSYPDLPPDSPGSSVSTRLKDEYDELLKYAVVVPTYDPMSMPKSLADFRGSFTAGTVGRSVMEEEEEEEGGGEDSGTEVGESVSPCEETEPRTAPQPHHISQSTPLLRTRREARTRGGEEREEERQGRSLQTDLPDGCVGGPRPAPPDSPGSQVSSILPGGVGAGAGEEHSAYGFSLTVDQDITRMEGLMATWLGDLNRNVLAEFGQSKIRLLEYYKHQLHKEKEKYAADKNRVENEMSGLKELLHTYEQSIERKDEVIANLTRAMQKQRDKFDMAKTFCEWKIRHNDNKREAFASNMAYRHYQRTLSQKVWDAWHSLVESRWRGRVEKACQAKAQEVCMSLTNDYETRLASLNEALEASRAEVSRLHTERERYEETMKKAFMRGVCALNLEAMSMFHEGDEQTQGSESGSVGPTSGPPPGPPSGPYPGPHSGPVPGPHSGPHSGPPPGVSLQDFVSAVDRERLGLPHTFQQEAVYSTEPPGAPSPRVVTSQGGTSSRSTISQASSRSGTSITSTSSRTKAGQKGKLVTAKLSARSDSAGGRSQSGKSLAPPMSSVIVERHQPVTKATIGQATASHYPRNGSADQTGGIIQRKIAGQRPVPMANLNIQTIKMVD